MKEENWALSIMQTLILDLRNFARRADRRCGGKPGERQEKAAGTMMQVLSAPILIFLFLIRPFESAFLITALEKMTLKSGECSLLSTSCSR